MLKTAAKNAYGGSLFEAALAYAELGWASFPISRAKTPLSGSHGYRDASTQPAQLRDLFSHPDASGLAVATGVSKLVVIDIDPRNGGTETAARVLADELPPHPVKRTPRGGVHRVFRAPVCSVIATKAHALGPGIDVEASGSGVMFAPPTRGYVWEVSPRDVPAAWLPLWLWRLLPKVVESPPKSRRKSGKREIPFSVAEVIQAGHRLGRVKKGSRGWQILCPAHADRHNSLSLQEGTDGQPLLHCFAGCSFAEILAAIQRLRGAA